MRPLLFGTLALVTVASHAAAQSCREALGPQRSRELVRQCTEVSTATRPPCNARNACGLIVDEIRRGCRMLGEGGDGTAVPRFCERYR